MPVLGLDLASQWCGYALLAPGSVRVASGVWMLKHDDETGPWSRWPRLRRHLDATLESVELLAVAYEKVCSHAPGAVLAAHVYGDLEHSLRRWAEEWDLPVIEVGVGQAKKILTGRGDARKGEMVEAALKRWPELGERRAVLKSGKPGKVLPLKHDEADALGIALVGQERM